VAFLFNPSQMKKTLIWIAVLPVAILSGILSNYVINFMFTGTVYHTNFTIFHLPKWVTIYDNKIIISLQALISPLVFLIVGLKITPNHKRETGFVLVTMLFMTGIAILIFYLIMDMDFKTRDYLFFIFHFIACITGFSLIPKTDQSFNEGFE